MQDVTRYLIIMLVINVIMSIIGGAISSGTFNSEDYLGRVTNVGGGIKSIIETEAESGIISGESWQQQTSWGNEQNLGFGVMVKLFFQGINPFTKPAGGFETDTEEMGYNALAMLRLFMYTMTGVLLYLVIKNRKT